MKAIEIVAPGETRLVDLEVPALIPGHVLLKLAYVGFCGSDLSTFRGLNPLARKPVIPGHEIAATIHAVAGDVPGHLREGLAVTVNPYTNCRRCPACANRKPNACEYNETLGVQRDGAMAEYLLIPWEKVIADATIPLRDLALVEPLSVGFHAVDRAIVTDDDYVLVMGCGMIGVGAIIRSAIRGATVIAVDVDDQKLEVAKRLGAKYIINTAKEELLGRVQDITGRRGADVVIEAVGRPETYVAAISTVGFTGRVVYIGYAKDKIPFDTQYIVKKELQILGSRNALPKDFEAVIKYLSEGNCPTDDLVSAVFVPEKAQSALESWAEKPGDVFRILIKF